MTAFSVDTSASIKKLKPAGTLNYESGTTNYAFTIEVTDSVHTATISVGITITDVNEAPPVFNPTSYTKSIAEDATLGASVTIVTATDADTADKVVFSIISGNNDNKFAIDSNTGLLIVAGGLDADITTTYNLVVKATDAAAVRSATASVTITVTNVNDNTPKYAQNIYYVTINEDKTAGALLTLTATDVDPSTSFTYTLEASSTPATYTTYFGFDSTTRNQLNLLASIDLDTSGVQSFYTLVVMVTDDGSPARSSTSSVLVSVNSVNEHTPTLGGDTFTIAESANHGAQVGILTALDSDLGVDGEKTYTILSGNGNGKFALDPISGAISVLGSLDYETLTSYSLNVKVADGGTPTKTVTAAVTINVSAVSDEKPKCTTNSFFESITEPGVLTSQTYVQLACTDADGQTLSYSLTGNTGPTFAISSNGSITLAAAVDYDGTVKLYNMKVTVTDPSSNSVTIPVIIEVKPTNELKPVFPADKIANCNEDKAVGSNVATHVATDGDSNTTPDGVITYSIQSVTNGGLNHFSIDPTTAVIILAKPLDFETAQTYVITVLATDGGSTPSSATGLVTVTVNNINDATPQCTSPSLAVTVSEDKS
ncbi:protocadherin Fat 1-like [Dreissena polymorpha]|uniref:protocadherin Fat 1-like n=1 Tax=Dreissena polymorpha TaxID=45954 RepID=UPI002265113B|nr:protocadherin Fat 1-like [Dreissena polymorpha]